MTKPLHGVYGILPSGLDTVLLLEKAEAALQGGVKTLQFRNKTDGYKRALKQAKALRVLTRSYDARLIVNDSLQMMQDCDADGVHLGRDDVAQLSEVRGQMRDEQLLGITCRADAAFAKHALHEGVDYVSFGAVFASSSKPEVPVLGLPRLQKARAMFPNACLCAIGGISAENIVAVKQTGVDALAVISGLFDTDDVRDQAEKLCQLWEAA